MIHLAIHVGQVYDRREARHVLEAVSVARFVGGLTALACLLTPGTALARAPVLLAVGQASGHLTVSWSLPPGVLVQEIVADPACIADPDFGLAAPEYGWSVVGGYLTPTQTSFRSPGELDPGTYCVRVGGEDSESPLVPQWSNILRAVITTPPKPPPPPPATGRYRGRTEFPDSRPISFGLSSSRRRVTKLRIKARLDCSRRGFPAGQLYGGTTIRSVRVSAGYVFRARTRVQFRQGGALTVVVKGRFRPPQRARGTLRVRARLPGGVRCSSFPIKRLKWSVRRR